jgi:hypothetical protein
MPAITSARRHARVLKASEDAYQTRLGHAMRWTSRHGVRWLKSDPGYKGVCTRCGDVRWVIPTGGNTAYFGSEDASGKHVWAGRKCRRRR